MVSRSFPERFEVAFSFAGEQRELVRSIAEAVERILGTGTVFFDEWFEAFVADLDAERVLQRIYHERAVLVVACISQRYDDKSWTQAEWEAIRALRSKLRASKNESDRLRILPIRVGDGDVEGVLDLAICPDVRRKTPDQAAQLIVNRLSLIQTMEDRPGISEARAKAVQNPIAASQHDTGTMAEDNPWYVERRVDEQVYRALSNHCRTVAISGLPQSGKSSMAIRIGKRLRAQGYLEARLNLKTDLREADFASADTFFPALAGAVARKLGRGDFEAKSVASPETLASFLRSLASAAGDRFLLTLVAFDHLFAKPTSLEIQSHLRSFHNATAAAPLNHLRLILVHTKRPPDGKSPYGSIFDMAEKFKANDFSQQELLHLVSLYGNCLSNAETDTLLQLLAGHPALSRRALNDIVEENQTFSEFCSAVETNAGIFLDDMRKLLLEFEKPAFAAHKVAFARAMHRIRPCGTELDYEVLHSLGLVTGTFSGDADPRCRMFEKWFSHRLSRPRS